MVCHTVKLAIVKNFNMLSGICMQVRIRLMISFDFKDEPSSEIEITEDIDSEYEPEESESSDDDVDEEDVDEEDMQVDDRISDSESELSDIHPLEICKKITVLKCGENSKGNRNNKVHACVFCEKMFTNIARHMSLKHHNEAEVARILTHPKKSKERRKMWDSLVKKGDFSHNHCSRKGKWYYDSKVSCKKW
jgi:hypothetical protein